MKSERDIDIYAASAAALGALLAVLCMMFTGCSPFPDLTGVTLDTATCVTPPTEAIASRWTFDHDDDKERVLDNGGRDNHGIRYRGVASVQGTHGSEAYSFDGIDDYVKITDHASLNFGAGKSLGFTFWIKLPEGLPSSLESILDKRVDGVVPQGYHIYIYNGAIGVQIADGATYGNFPGPALPTNVNATWVLVSISIDRGTAPAITWSVGGTTTTTQTPTMPLGSLVSNSPLYIAAHAYAIDRHFTGMLDEIVLYNGTVPSTLAQSLLAKPMCK